MTWPDALSSSLSPSPWAWLSVTLTSWLFLGTLSLSGAPAPSHHSSTAIAVGSLLRGGSVTLPERACWHPCPLVPDVPVVRSPLSSTPPTCFLHSPLPEGKLAQQERTQLSPGVIKDILMIPQEGHRSRVKATPVQQGMGRLAPTSQEDSPLSASGPQGAAPRITWTPLPLPGPPLVCASCPATRGLWPLLDLECPCWSPQRGHLPQGTAAQ